MATTRATGNSAVDRVCSVFRSKPFRLAAPPIPPERTDVGPLVNMSCVVMARMIMASGGFRHGLCELCHLLNAREAVPFFRTSVATEGDSLALVDADQVVGDIGRLNGVTHHGAGCIDELRADFDIQGLLCDLECQLDLGVTSQPRILTCYF